MVYGTFIPLRVLKSFGTNIHCEKTISFITDLRPCLVGQGHIWSKTAKKVQEFWKQAWSENWQLQEDIINFLDFYG